MHVVRHQDVGVDAAAVPAAPVTEFLEIKAVIIFTGEYDVVVVSSLDNVLRVARKKISRLSRHCRTSV